MIIESCSICPRNCGACRDDESGGGFCRMPAAPVIARAGLHFYEEPCISGTNGSGTVFFSGCSLCCVFCQNFEISRNGFGKAVEISRLADIFKELEQSGAHNINLVNPTHFVPAIKAALDLYRPQIPVVYNCGGYETVETLKTLEGYVDIYLPDLKYTQKTAGQRYSSAGNYFDFAAPALLEMQRQTADEIMDGEIMRRGMIVRHLLLPQGTAQAIGAAQFVKDNLPSARFSLMSQYMPVANAADFPEINRKISRREYQKVLSAVEDMGFANTVYIQDRESSDSKYVPCFDLSGI